MHEKFLSTDWDEAFGEFGEWAEELLFAEEDEIEEVTSRWNELWGDRPEFEGMGEISDSDIDDIKRDVEEHFNMNKKVMCCLLKVEYDEDLTFEEIKAKAK